MQDKYFEHQRVLNAVQVVISDVLSHEIPTVVSRLRFLLRVEFRLDRLQVEEVIKLLSLSKYVHCESNYNGLETMYLEPKLDKIDIPHSVIPQSRYIT